MPHSFGSPEFQAARASVERLFPSIENIPGLQGVSIGLSDWNNTDSPLAIYISLLEGTEQKYADLAPKEFEGYAVIVEFRPEARAY